MGEGIVFEIHRSASCGCCGEYEDYLKERGVEVREVIREDVVQVKEAHGIPQELYSCHTSIVGVRAQTLGPARTGPSALLTVVPDAHPRL